MYQPLLPANCLSVFDHFVGLALKGLKLKGSNCFSVFDHLVGLTFKGLKLKGCLCRFVGPRG